MTIFKLLFYNTEGFIFNTVTFTIFTSKFEYIFTVLKIQNNVILLPSKIS